MINTMSCSSSHFGRYVSQTEHCMEDLHGSNDWNQPQALMTDIQPLMSISTTAPMTSATISKRIPPAPETAAVPVAKEKLEALPFPQHAPGPIQRPNKLVCSTTVTQQQPAPFFSSSALSPMTPDVLDQINRLLDHQNSMTASSSSTLGVVPNMTETTSMSETIMSGLGTPNVQWTNFSPSEWPPKLESKWPLSGVQSPLGNVTNSRKNPFSIIASATSSVTPSSTVGDDSIWSSLLGTGTPRPPSSSIQTPSATTWTDVFAGVPPSPEPSIGIKPINRTVENSNGSRWMKIWQTSDSTIDTNSLSQPSTPGNTTSLWNPLDTMNIESLPTITPPIGQGALPQYSSSLATSTNWWPEPSADENNNASTANNDSGAKAPAGDTTPNNHDHSVWDFARLNNA